MSFNEFYFIEGQSVQGKMKIIDPFTFTPEYPDKILTYQQLPITPLDLVSVYKDNKSYDSVKEEKKKCRRNKLLKLILIAQIMNNQK